MVKGIVGPLNWNVPIVDKEGRPTPEFQQKWREQARVNDSVPDISDAQAVSALLDLIGSTSGQILIRGPNAWGVLSSPGGTDMFLRADGSYAVPQVVSTAAPGFAPQLPDDDTKFLDGKGQWSTPAGGGGGGSADQVSYDNTESGLEATNVQAAIDELRRIISVILTLEGDVTALNEYILAEVPALYGAATALNEYILLAE